MTQEHVPNPAVPSRGADAPSALRLEGVTVRFGGILALSDVSLEVEPGEIVGLIGPNGAGKTTLIDVVAGNRRPQAGEVMLYGQRVTHMAAMLRARRGMARTFQKLSLFDGMTVWEHVLLGYAAGRQTGGPRLGFLSSRARLEKAARAETGELSPAALLGQLGLADVADELASTQAVGVVRMVDLARALASRPRMLLLDEPVSGLPEPEARAVAAVIQSIRRQHAIAMLVIEHNLEFARLVADRVIALDFGKVIADGAPDEVLSSRELRVAYFGADAEEEAAIQHATGDVQLILASAPEEGESRDVAQAH
jgi:ABC-type branched-subunit amino acid transport system ATPase component